MVVGGVEYVTTTDACERLAPDVTPRMLRDWKLQGLIDVARNPAGEPIRMPSPKGAQNVYRWLDVVETEYATRTSKGGRPRSG